MEVDYLVNHFMLSDLHLENFSQFFSVQRMFGFKNSG